MNKANLLLIHGGPGYDDSYFYPYFNDLSSLVNVTSYSLGERINTTSDFTLNLLISELESKIAELSPENTFLLAHSFGSVLALNLCESTLNALRKVILSNWIYDCSWLDEFYEKFPEEKEYKSKGSLRSDALHYNKYYFNDQTLGTKILDNIIYNDKLQSDLSYVYNDLNLESQLLKFRNNIISISSSNDNITSQSYIKNITQKINIPNHNIENAGHFPFIENQKDYMKAIRLIAGANS